MHLSIYLAIRQWAVHVAPYLTGGQIVTLNADTVSCPLVRVLRMPLDRKSTHFRGLGHVLHKMGSAIAYHTNVESSRPRGSFQSDPGANAFHLCSARFSPSTFHSRYGAS